jgi:hypothetical protein
VSQVSKNINQIIYKAIVKVLWRAGYLYLYDIYHPDPRVELKMEEPEFILMPADGEKLSAGYVHVGMNVGFEVAFSRPCTLTFERMDTISRWCVRVKQSNIK